MFAALYCIKPLMSNSLSRKSSRWSILAVLPCMQLHILGSYENSFRRLASEPPPDALLTLPLRTALCLLPRAVSDFPRYRALNSGHGSLRRMKWSGNAVCRKKLFIFLLNSIMTLSSTVMVTFSESFNERRIPHLLYFLSSQHSHNMNAESSATFSNSRRT